MRSKQVAWKPHLSLDREYILYLECIRHLLLRVRVFL
jgi:hypothetical protein